MTILKCWQGCRATGTLYVVSGNARCCKLLQKTASQFLTQLNIHLHMVQQSKRNEKIFLHEVLYVNVYSNCVHKSPKLKTVQMSLNCWMDKQIVLYLTVALKRNKPLIHASTWILTSSTLLNERNQI